MSFIRRILAINNRIHPSNLKQIKNFKSNDDINKKVNDKVSLISNEQSSTYLFYLNEENKDILLDINIEVKK